MSSRAIDHSIPTNYPIEVTYINPNGFKCRAIIKNPSQIHHSWYSSKRNIAGVYEEHKVSVICAFLRKLKNCTNIEVKQSEYFV